VWLQPRHTVATAVAICAAAALLLIFISAERDYGEITFDFGIVRCLFGFFVGSLTYRLTLAHPFSGAGATAVLAEIAALLAAIGFVATAGDVLPPATGAVVFAAAIYVFAAETGPVSRLLRSPPATALGTWSYAIYMTHLLVMTVLIQTGHVFEKATHLTLFRSASATEPDLVMIALSHSLWWTDGATLVYIAITLALSAAVCRWIEIPGRAAFGRYARRLTAPPPALWSGATAALRRS
jgi:peptidoglycan/LPS O-acetylase OafA/YrhL